MSASAIAAPSPGTARTVPSRTGIALTGVERPFADDEIIVSKTDLTGKITYVNDVFVRVAQYSRSELMGAPHSIIRHPDMPRAVFQLLWDTIKEGREVFAYVLNLARSGDHYWVYAHVTPTFDRTGRVVSYHSNRRTVKRSALPDVQALYAELRAIEQGIERGSPGQDSSKRAAIAASVTHLTMHLTNRGQSYDEFVWSF